MKTFKTLGLAKEFASDFMKKFSEIVAVEFEDVIGDGVFSINVTVSKVDYNKDILKSANGLIVRGF